MLDFGIVCLPYYLSVGEQDSRFAPGDVRRKCSLLHPAKEDILVTEQLLRDHALVVNNIRTVQELPITKLAELFDRIPPRWLFEVRFVKQDGTLRTLYGFKKDRDSSAMGMSSVIDLQVTEGSNTRTVDHRHLLSVVPASPVSEGNILYRLNTAKARQLLGAN